MAVHSALFEPLLSCWEQGGNPWLDFDEFISCSRPQQQAAFVKDEQLLYLWHDENIDFITYATQMTRDFLDQVIHHHWRPNREPVEELMPTSTPVDEACGAISFRRPALVAATHVAVNLVIVVGLFLGLGARQVAIEIATDRNWRRLGFVAIVPMQIWLSLFFVLCIVGAVAQVFGPVRQLVRDSQNYSGARPVWCGGSLPLLTIQCPVYKEGLPVIRRTMQSVELAMKFYGKHKGKCNIFINDDGLQMIPGHAAQERKDFYQDKSIAWVARPRANADPSNGTVFERPGRFKKASNMKYALRISTLFAALRSTSLPEEQCWNAVKQQNPDVEMGGKIVLGDYILLIDSDTEVPKNCLALAVQELQDSPEVAILHFVSGVMNECHGYSF